MKRIGVIGAGSWGTALANTLAYKGHRVALWDIDPAHLASMEACRENRAFLPGVQLHDNVVICAEAKEALKGIEVALFSAPAQHFRPALANALPFLSEEIILVNVAKGIEQKTLRTMSQIAGELAPDIPYVVLSGPSHAEEVGQMLPTTVAVASRDIKHAECIQDVFMTDRFRVYTNHDVLGVELGGALKNIIALGAGISDGMGFGDNAKAAMMTRGIAEISRLGLRLGAQVPTFAGLAGIGDLIVTCTSPHSRNRRCGMMIGQGMPPSEAVRQIGMVVEGMYTAEAAYQLARQVGVEMPITECIYRVIKEQIGAGEAVEVLMGRERKHESV